MLVKSYYKTQRELADTVNYLIDMYWENNLEEDSLIQNIEKIYKNNEMKFIKNNTYTKILQQQCGKKRLEVVEHILNTNAKVKSDV